MREFLEALKVTASDDTPLAGASRIQEIITQHTGCADPYEKIKEDCNREAGKWLPYLKKEVEDSDEPLRTALKIAAMGNIMDYGAFARFDLPSLIDQMHSREFALNAEDDFISSLEQARTITYLADNTGEIYFDSILIERLCELDKVESLKLVIRSSPFLNDVSSEAFVPACLLQHPKVTIRQLPLLKTEQDPQTWMELTSSDLIISKGMANFENYSEEAAFYFLLISKCDLVSRILQEKSIRPVRTGDWIFWCPKQAQGSETVRALRVAG